MARTPTYPIPLGFTAPNFELLEPASGKHRSLDALKGENATVLLFICNHCPFVVHVQDELVRLANDFMPLGVGFIAISSNDAEHYPQDGPSEMAAHALRHHYPFPYLYDETQEVAKAYYAACTPDISVFDAQIRCVYRGQLDASRPGNRLRSVCATSDGGCNGYGAYVQLPYRGCNGYRAYVQLPIEAVTVTERMCNFRWRL
jgi:peroxiredoxin